VLFIRRLKKLLYVKGYTLEGAKQLLSSPIQKAVSEETIAPVLSSIDKSSVHQAVQALEDLVSTLEISSEERESI